MSDSASPATHPRRAPSRVTLDARGIDPAGIVRLFAWTGGCCRGRPEDAHEDRLVVEGADARAVVRLRGGVGRVGPGRVRLHDLHARDAQHRARVRRRERGHGGLDHADALRAPRGRVHRRRRGGSLGAQGAADGLHPLVRRVRRSRRAGAVVRLDPGAAHALRARHGRRVDVGHDARDGELADAQPRHRLGRAAGQLGGGLPAGGDRLGGGAAALGMARAVRLRRPARPARHPHPLRDHRERRVEAVGQGARLARLAFGVRRSPVRQGRVGLGGDGPGLRRLLRDHGAVPHAPADRARGGLRRGGAPGRGLQRGDARGLGHLRGAGRAPGRGDRHRAAGDALGLHAAALRGHGAGRPRRGCARLRRPRRGLLRRHAAPSDTDVRGRCARPDGRHRLPRGRRAGRAGAHGHGRAGGLCAHAPGHRRRRGGRGCELALAVVVIIGRRMSHAAPEALSTEVPLFEAA